MELKGAFRFISRCSVTVLAMVILLLSAVPVISAAEEPLIFIDFEDGTINGFDVRGNLRERENNGTGILSVSTDVAHSGEYSLLITGRQQNWNGVAFNIAPYIEADVVYEISFFVHANTPESSNFTLSTQITEFGPPWINLSDPINIGVSSGWVQISELRSYTQDDIDTGHITVYIENSTNDGEYYIDDFSVTAKGGGAAWDPFTEPITRNMILPSERLPEEFRPFDFEFWSQDSGEGQMQLTGPGTFFCNWTNAHNILFRSGKKLGNVMSYTEYGDIIIDYRASHYIQEGSVSYLTAYGWTVDPLMEWYVVEKHGDYKPGSGGEMHDRVEIDGALYEIWTDWRVNQPSIQGTQTFLQIFSIRVDHRTEGVITISDHFKAWEELGLDVGGPLYEVSMCIEGFRSTGSGSISKLHMTIGNEKFIGEPFDAPEDPSTPTPAPAPAPDPEPATTPEPINMPPDEPGGARFPVWAIILIIGGVIAVVFVIVLFIKKKQ